MENPLVVSKFGGTSMGDALAMRQSAQIAVRQNSDLVVVSATAGTTNLLIELVQISEQGSGQGSGQSLGRKTAEKAEALQTQIFEKHKKIAADLKVPQSVYAALQVMFDEIQSLSRGIQLLRDASPRVLDTMMSLGERMSSILFAEAWRQSLVDNKRDHITIHWIDARDYLITDDQFGRAKPKLDQLKRRSVPVLTEIRSGQSAFVTQGFIGATEEGTTTTLGRGGSDYSAALFAEALGATALEIWTDVPGIATTDPRICPGAKSISEISFTETSELATFGAKVLHPATLLPALRQDIPVFVGSTFEPDQKGTWVRHWVKDQPLIRAIATRKKQILLTLSTPDMLQTHGFLYQIFKVFNDHKVSIDAVTTSEVSVSMTLDDSAILNKKLVHDLAQFAEVNIEENLALVALIGNQINHTPGLARRVFDSVGNINVRMICLGASRHNFCLLVKEDLANEVVQRLHHTFIELESND
jgi:aspartate kinase